MKLTRPVLLFCLALALQSAWAETTTLHIGGHRIHAEIADTPQSRKRGLMHRTYLCPDCGMLFVFKEAKKHEFWMKNTPLPLSIAFIAAGGTILNIEEMQPNTPTVHSARGEAMYVLEMNSGWFARKGVKAGQKIRELPLKKGTPGLPRR